MSEAQTESTAFAELDARPIQVTPSPILSVFILLLDALQPHPYLDCGLGNDVRHAVRAALPPSTQRILAPLVSPHHRWPDALLPRPTTTIRDMDDVLVEIVDTPADQLLAELAREGLAETPEWRPVMRAPREWLVVYASAMRRAWEAVAPRLRDAVGRIEHEVERVELASRRSAVPELVASLSPLAPVRDDQWLLPGEEQRRLRIPDTGLSLIPLVTGPGGFAQYHDAESRLTHFAYALPRIPPGERPPTPESQLEALLGRPRALVLRLLDVPLRPGDIAQTLAVSPSAATYHLDALEGAGLARRHRHKRHVWVERTQRGEALLALFER